MTRPLRIALLIAWLVSALFLVPGLARAAPPSDDTRSRPDVPLASKAIVYARLQPVGKDTWRWQALWRPAAGDAAPRVVYQTRPGFPRFGVMFGFLPSPDGRWLLVWETRLDSTGVVPEETRWRLVALPSGRRMYIGDQPGLQGFLPYWLDGHRLLLEKGERAALFDADTGRRTGALPAPVRLRYALRDIDDRTEGEDLRRGFVTRHLAAAKAAVSAAFRRSEDQFGLRPYLAPSGGRVADRLGDMLVRPLGIVVTGAIAIPFAGWPELAVSPQGHLIARSAVLAEAATPGPSAEAPSPRFAYRGHVDVYRATSGEHVWGQETPLWESRGADQDVLFSPAFGHEPFFQDLRWSADGHYLSFTQVNPPGSKRGSVVLCVYDLSAQRQVLRVPDALDAFVIPLSGAPASAVPDP